jgi:hypothetical protein
VIRHKFFLPDGVAPTEKSLLGSLNQRLGKLGVPPAANFAAVERVQAEIQQQLGSSKNVERLTQFHKLRALLSQWPNTAAFKPLITLLKSSIEELNAELQRQLESIPPDFLTEAKDILNKLKPALCPVCEQTIDCDVVAVRLGERIEANGRVLAAKRTLQSRRKAVVDALRAPLPPMELLLKEWQAVTGSKIPATYQQSATLIREVIDEVEQPDVTSDRLAIFLQRLDGTVLAHGELNEKLNNMIAAESDSIQQELSTVQMMSDLLLKDWPKHEEFINDLQHNVRNRDGVSRILAHAINSRKEIVQRILDDISEKANRFYEIIHPGENYIYLKTFDPADRRWIDSPRVAILWKRGSSTFALQRVAFGHAGALLLSCASCTRS